MSFATRSSVGGCVENIFELRPPGVSCGAIIMCAIVRSSRCGGVVSPLIAIRADASPCGYRVSSTAPASATNSRLRLIDSWMIVAAIGARIATKEHHEQADECARPGVATVATAARDHPPLRRIRQELRQQAIEPASTVAYVMRPRRSCGCA